MNMNEAKIRLTSVTEENWIEVASLTVNDEQKRFLAPPIGILARGYVYRDCNAKVYVVVLEEKSGESDSLESDNSLGSENDKVNSDKVIGVALVREFTDEPLWYDLQQFMIDKRYQGKGYGTWALMLILDELKKEHHYDHVEVCVDKEDAPALRVYEKCGFVDSGFIDEDLPDSMNLICRF